MNPKMRIGVAALAVGMASVAFAKDTWNVVSGEWMSGSSWKTGLVPDSELSDFPATGGDVTATFSGGASETSYTTIEAAEGSVPRTVLLDASNGGWWRKFGYSATGVALRFQDSAASGTVFALDNAGKSATALEVPRIVFTNGVIRYVASDDSALLEFLGGDFNAYDPDGATVTATDRPQVLSGSLSDLPVGVVVRGDARVRVRSWAHYSNAPDSYVRFENGQTEIVDNFSIKDDSSAAGTPPARVDVLGGRLWVGGNLGLSMAGTGKPCAHSVLSITNDADVRVGGALNVAGGCYTNGAIVHVAGHASLTVSNGFCSTLTSSSAGYGTTSLVEIAEHASFDFGGSFLAGRHFDGHQQIRLRDSATMNQLDTSTVCLGYNKGSTRRTSCELTIEDSATCSLSHAILAEGASSGGYPSTGVISVRGNGTLTLAEYLYIGSQLPASTGIVEIADNALVSVAGAMIVGRSNGVGILRLKGGTFAGKKSIQTTGTGSVEADGGTVRADSTSLTFAVPVALGSRGLTLDSNGNNLTIARGMSDLGDAEGLFVKKGAGTLTVTAESTHAKTCVEGGTVILGSGVTAYGRNLVLNGGTLDASASGMSVDSLTLGGAAGVGTVRLSGDHPVTVRSAGGFRVADGCVELADNTAVGTFAVFETQDELTDADLAKLRIVNRANGYSYRFTVEDGTVRLSVAAHDAGTTVWTGRTGDDWKTDGNWTSGIPAGSDTAVFPADAEVKSVTLAGRGEAGKLLFEGGEYELSGGALDASVGFTVEVSPAATAEVATAVCTSSGAFVKAGRGILAWSGDNAGLSATAITSNGTLLVRDPLALGDPGKPGTLTIAGGTFAWDAAPTTLVRNVSFAGSHPMAIRTDRDLTLRGTTGFPVAGSALVKIGPARLTFDYPAGKSTLSRDAFSLGTLVDPIDYDANGCIDSSGGYTTLNVFDGTLALKGEGSDATSVTAYRTLAVGAPWVPQVSPVMWMEGLTYTQGAQNYRSIVGAYMTNNVAHPPALVLADDVKFNTVNFSLGYHDNRAKGASSRLYITNSTLTASTSCYLPFTYLKSDYRKAVVRIGAGGLLRVTCGEGAERSSAGLHIGTCDIRIENGGAMSAGDALPLCYDDLNYGGGVLTVADGGSVSAIGILGVNTSGPAGVTNVYDAGTLELTASGTSLFAQPAAHPTVAGARGMTVRIPADVTHRIAFPVVGEGVVVKSGAGTLRVGKVLDWVDDETWTETDLPVFGNDGGLRADEGIVDFGGETLALGKIGGGGTFRNGTVSCTIDVPAGGTDALPRFEDIILSKVTVDFNMSEPCAEGTTIAVARLGSGVVTNVSGWRRKNAAGLGATFTVVDGVVLATLEKHGMVLIFR